MHPLLLIGLGFLSIYVGFSLLLFVHKRKISSNTFFVLFFPFLFIGLLCFILLPIPSNWILAIFIALILTVGCEFFIITAVRQRGLESFDWRDADSLKPYGNWAEEMTKKDSKDTKKNLK